MGLQAKASLTLVAVVVVAAAAIGVTTFRRARTQMLASVTSQAHQTAHLVAAASAEKFHQRNKRALIELSQRLIEGHDLLYAAFVESDGRIVAAAQKPHTLVDLLDETGQRIDLESPNGVRLRSLSEGQLAIEAAAPIDVPSGLAGAASEGVLLLAVDLEPVRARLAALARRAIELASAVAIAVIAGGFLVMRRLVGPINRLAAAALQLAQKHEFQRLPVGRNDEIGELTKAFNYMADKLLRAQGKLHRLNSELERRVAERTLELQARNELLKHMASKDPLTGLFNRRHFNELMVRMFAEATRYGHELACMMIDLDNFKQANDLLGHQAGDLLIQQAANAIREQLRQSDVAARYGGDEFVILLPHSNAMEAFQSAKRIREAFQATLAARWENLPAVSLSIGIADLHVSGSRDGDALLRAADEALYRAKRMGKDTVCAAVSAPVKKSRSA